MKKLSKSRKEILKDGERVFTHSKYQGKTIHEISQDEGFMYFVIHKRIPCLKNDLRNLDYQRLINYYNLRKQDLELKERHFKDDNQQFKDDRIQ